MRVGLQEETYLEPFQTEGFYENLVPLFLPAAADDPSNPNNDIMLPGKLRFRDVVNNLEQDDWNAIAGEIVPPEYVKQEFETNLPIIFGFANGNLPRFDVVVDTGIVRENLLGEPGDRMVNRIFNTWPNCSPEQETQIQDFIDEKTDIFPYCKPSEPALQRETFALLTASKNELANEIPETFIYRHERARSENITLREVDLALYNDVQRPIAFMQAGGEMLAILQPCALLALVVILGVSSAKSFFAWIGWPVALAGIMTLLPLAVVPVILASLNTSTHTDAEAFQSEALRSAGRAMVVSFTQPILTQGTLLVAIGFISMLIAAVMPDPDEELYYASLEGSTAQMPVTPPLSPRGSPSVIAPLRSSIPPTAPPPPPPLELPEPSFPPQFKKKEDAAPRRIKIPIDVKKPSDGT